MKTTFPVSPPTSRHTPVASRAWRSGSVAGARMQRFLPEHLTPLFHTSAYAGLTDEQRMRYNQYQGLYFNEQVAFFATAIARPVLAALIADPSLQGLAGALRQF